jgi:SNF2 family DNA or RNA helicase
MNTIPSRDDILSLFQPSANQPIVSFFSREQCHSLKQPQLIAKSIETGIPIPKDIQTSKDKITECDLLIQGIEKQYNSIPFVQFNEELAIQKIVHGTGVQLQPHQVQVAKHLLYHRGLLAVHRTGSGKTFTSILSLMLVKMKYPNLRTVVFLPAALKANFVEQMIKFGVSPLGVKYATPSLTGSKAIDLIVSLQIEVYSFEEYIAFYKSSKVVPSFENAFIVIDEAHRLRSQIKWNKEKEIREGQLSFCMMLAASQAFRVLLLTATPFINAYTDVLNLFAMIEGISPLPDSLPDRSTFEAIAEDDEEFVKYAKCKVSFYYPEIKEDNSDFPKQMNMPLVIFPMNPYYFEKYTDIESSIAREKNESFYRRLRLAEIALDGEYSPKVDWVINFIVSEAEKGRKSVVFSNWIYAGIHLIRRRLDLLASTPQRDAARYVPIIGEISTDDRKRFKDIYNEGIAKIMLISKAGSEGLDLTNTRNVIILESNWNPSMDFQIIGRAVRYKSHSTLPKEERTVRVWRLLMRKPPSQDPNALKSIDDELYKLSYEIKLPKSNRMLNLLKKASIEENKCDSIEFESLQDITVQDKIYFKSRPKETYREIVFDYIAPELTSLVKPEELTEEQYRKLAGTNVSPEQMEEVRQFLEQKKEETEGVRIVPILLDEEDWL